MLFYFYMNNRKDCFLCKVFLLTGVFSLGVIFGVIGTLIYL
jgi:hypothetical protein